MIRWGEVQTLTVGVSLQHKTEVVEFSSHSNHGGGMRITACLCNQERRQVGTADLLLRRQSLCLGLVLLDSEAGARGQPYPRVRASRLQLWASKGVQRAVCAGLADKNAARSHSNCYVPLFWLVNSDESKYINPVTLVTQCDLVRTCGRMPACAWEQHAVKRAGWMMMQLAASSR